MRRQALAGNTIRLAARAADALTPGHRLGQYRSTIRSGRHLLIAAAAFGIAVRPLISQAGRRWHFGRPLLPHAGFILAGVCQVYQAAGFVSFRLLRNLRQFSVQLIGWAFNTA